MKKLLISAALIALYVWGHAYATDWRGYVAYGGELVFLILLPFVWAGSGAKK